MPSSTRYCLFQTGAEYMIYQPAAGAFTVDLPAGHYHFTWIEPGSGKEADTGIITVRSGDESSFDPPFDGDAILHLGRKQSIRQQSN